MLIETRYNKGKYRILLYFLKENWKKTEGIKTLFKKVNVVKMFIKKLNTKIIEWKTKKYLTYFSLAFIITS